MANMSDDVNEDVPAVDRVVAVEPWVMDIVRCPVTHAPLVGGVNSDGEPELHSTDSLNPLAYPVRDGIPVLLESEARSLRTS